MTAVFKSGLICVLVLSLLTGCSYGFINPNDTMRAPRATGELEGVQDALESEVGEDIILKYPKCNGRRSAFAACDLNNDGKTEVIAFYQLRLEGNVTRMNLLTRDSNSNWKSVQDMGPIGNELLEIQFSDLDGDGADDLITGWSIYSSKTNQLCVYKMQKNGLVQIASQVYSAFTVTDIDMNGTQEIAVALLDSVNKTSKISFYRYDENSLVLVGAADLDGNVASYSSIFSEKLKNGREAVFIDALKDTNTMITELVYYDNDTPVSRFYDEETQSTVITQRYNLLKCTDIDSDGYTEIPCATILKGFSIELLDGTNVDPDHYLINWRQYNGKDSTTNMTAWYCTALGCYYRFSSLWCDTVTVSVNDKTETITFRCVDEEKNDNIDLLKITRYSVGKWRQSPEKDCTVLQKTSDYVFAAKVFKTGSKSDVTINEAAKNFFLIDS